MADSWEIEYCEVSSRNDFDCQKILENILVKIIDRRKHIIRPGPFPPIYSIVCAYICYNIWYYLCCCFICKSKYN